MRLIDADAYANELAKGSIVPDDSYSMGIMVGVDYAIKKLEEMPTITLDDLRPHGRWIISSDGYYPYCSNCKKEPKSGDMTPYCPHCGAKMDMEEGGA